jgi:hypothetical protein
MLLKSPDFRRVSENKGEGLKPRILGMIIDHPGHVWKLKKRMNFMVVN